MNADRIARSASIAAVTAILGLGMAGGAANAQGYTGSAASTAFTLGATASPPTVQLPAYGTVEHRARTHDHTRR